MLVDIFNYSMLLLIVFIFGAAIGSEEFYSPKIYNIFKKLWHWHVIDILVIIGLLIFILIDRTLVYWYGI